MGLSNCFGTKRLGAFGGIVRGNLSLVGYLFALKQIILSFNVQNTGVSMESDIYNDTAVQQYGGDKLQDIGQTQKMCNCLSRGGASSLL